MDNKDLNVEQLFKKTAIQVKQVSNKKQIPWSEGIIFGDFYFNNENKYVSESKQKENNTNNLLANNNSDNMKNRQEISFWDSVDKNPSIEIYQLYLKKYPNGYYNELAKYKIEQLTQQIKANLKSVKSVKSDKKNRSKNLEEPVKSPIEKKLAKQGKLIIGSNVKNDNVLINGISKGSTKLELTLKPAMYKVQVSKNGYYTWEKKIQIK